jgi:tRNA (Thr-GGU) A37 N-methylase
MPPSLVISRNKEGAVAVVPPYFGAVAELITASLVYVLLYTDLEKSVVLQQMVVA